MVNFTITMIKMFLRTPQIIRKVAMASIWIGTDLVLGNLVRHILGARS